MLVFVKPDESNYGIFIAIVLPGFVVLLGIAHHNPAVATWLGNSSQYSATVGGFLMVTVASLFLGLVASTFRWLLIDTLHSTTGLKQPKWNFKKFASRDEELKTLISIHYHYYQFYANSIIAMIWFGLARWSSTGFSFVESLGISLLVTVFFLGSRDTLQKYYRRVGELLAG